jgi:glycosyltransferase involved in cell wall biosynthesis
MDSMNDTLTAGPESTTRESIPPGQKGRIVTLNIVEVRTSNFVQELERRGFQVSRFDVKNWRAAFARLVPFTRAILGSDAVLCGAVVPFQIPCILAAKLLRRPVIIDFPMDLTVWPFLTLPHWKWLVELNLRLADGVLTIRSREYVIAKFGLSKQRVRFVENCPDLALVPAVAGGRPRFLPSPNSFVICWSGGHAHHRLERFMPTFEALLELVPNVELLLIADPALPSVVESKRYAESAGFGDRVHAVPIILPTQDFYATIAHCHLWVASLGDDTLQGRQELRMEFLEAGLLHTAVIAAPTPAFLQHGFTDGREIIYIDPSDPRASALKIAEFARRPELLKQLGERLRAHVLQNFSFDKGVDDMLQMLMPGQVAPVSKHG